MQAPNVDFQHEELEGRQEASWRFSSCVVLVSNYVQGTNHRMILMIYGYKDQHHCVPCRANLVIRTCHTSLRINSTNILI